MSISLEHSRMLSIAELSALSAIELKVIQAEAKKLLTETKSLKDWIDGAIALKFEEKTQSLRHLQGKDTGSVRFEEEGIEVLSDLPKKTTWDQKKLAELAKRIAEAGDDPSEFIDISYKVSERKFTAWPESLRAQFAPARTLGIGKETFRLETIEETCS